MGKDTGADRVHLEGGCNVSITGLVASTGAGHQVPPKPPNLCNTTERPDRPSNSTACVEVWAGDSLTINGTGGANKGEVKADTAGFGGTNGLGWIGGLITITSILDDVTASGHAVQASSAPSGSSGGYRRHRARYGRRRVRQPGLQYGERCPGSHHVTDQYDHRRQHVECERGVLSRPSQDSWRRHHLLAGHRRAAIGPQAGGEGLGTGPSPLGPSLMASRPAGALPPRPAAYSLRRCTPRARRQIDEPGN